jgi:hypothetical protein
MRDQELYKRMREQDYKRESERMKSEGEFESERE